MPQARSSGSRSTGSKSSSSSKAKPAGAAAKRSTAAKSGGSAAKPAGTTRATKSAGTPRAAKSTGTPRATKAAGTPRAAKRTSATSSASAKTSATDPRLEAAAQRLRKLNERIIEAGKEAGETTLSSYEKALKAIATSIERGPGSSDVDWISHLATAQAKFIRDVTTAWTSAARGVLKERR